MLLLCIPRWFCSPALLSVARCVSHLTASAVLLLSVSQPTLADPGIAAAPDAPDGLTVHTAPNGVPLVDIATPNRQGLSHNTYEHFNVNDRGAILNNVTGTTGTPTTAADGHLQGFIVNGGDITFGDQGGTLDTIDPFDLLTRRVIFNGAVTAKDVRTSVSCQQVDYAAGTAPEFSIDSTVFGGLYAGRITLLSTEQGVGVRAPAGMIANGDDLTITADGQLVKQKKNKKKKDMHYINDRAQLSASDAINTLGHEMSHYIDNNQDVEAAYTKTQLYHDNLGDTTEELANFQFSNK